MAALTHHGAFPLLAKLKAGTVLPASQRSPTTATPPPPVERFGPGKPVVTGRPLTNPDGSPVIDPGTNTQVTLGLEPTFQATPGTIQANILTLNGTTFTNTGFISADTINLNVQNLLNRQSVANIGQRYEQDRFSHWNVVNGETLEPGGVISANNWNISSRVQSITSGHGTFSLRDGTSEQNTAFFNTFRTTLGDIYQDQQINVNTQVDAHNNLKKPKPWKQILAMAASLLISMYLPGVMSGVIGSIFGSGVAATAASAAITAAAAGIASQLISNGRVDWDSLGKNVLVSALTAGITQHLGLNMDPEKFRNLSIGDKLVQTLKTGVVNAAVNVAINGGGTTAFLDSLKGSLLSMLTTHFTNQIPANWQGLEADIAHAVVGCLSARLGGGDCASGAIGGVLAHEIAPFVDDAVTSLLGSRNDPLRNPALTSVTALLSGLITQAVGRDGTTGFNTGVNAVLNNYLTEQRLRDACPASNRQLCMTEGRRLEQESIQYRNRIDACYANKGVCDGVKNEILAGLAAINEKAELLGPENVERLMSVQLKHWVEINAMSRNPSPVEILEAMGRAAGTTGLILGGVALTAYSGIMLNAIRVACVSVLSPQCTSSITGLVDGVASGYTGTLLTPAGPALKSAEQIQREFAAQVRVTEERYSGIQSGDMLVGAIASALAAKGYSQEQIFKMMPYYHPGITIPLPPRR